MTRAAQLRLEGVAGDEGGAIFSPDRVYRYRLWRGRDAERLCFVMLNPSKAGAPPDDDPTSIRCTGYARSWGFSGWTGVNLNALVATDPRELETHPDPIGPHNDEHLFAAATAARLVIVAWGVGGSLGNRDLIVAAALRARGVLLRCLATTSSGAPVHPLRQRGDLQPIPWPRPSSW